MTQNDSHPRGFRWLERLDRGAEHVEGFVLAAGILALAGITIANVIGRNLFAASLPFAEELNQTLIVLITFVGIGYGARQARHIRMSALYDQLGTGGRKALMVITAFGTALLLFLLAWYAVDYVMRAQRIGAVTPALQIPLWWVYLWVPVGFFLGGMQYLLTGIRNLTTPGVHLAYGQVDRCAEERER